MNPEKQKSHIGNNPNYSKKISKFNGLDSAAETEDTWVGAIIDASDKNREDLERERTMKAAYRVMAEDAKLDAEAARYEAETIKQESYVDSLTGCMNRKFLDDYISDHFDPNRDNKKVVIVFADMDNLKWINDNPNGGGHEEGDRCLRAMAKDLTKGFRKGDVVIRYGGDEFVVLCRRYSDDKHDTAEEFAEALLDRVSDIERISEISFSFGAALFDTSVDSSLESTVKRADNTMYEDKKNRLSVSA